MMHMTDEMIEMMDGRPRAYFHAELFDDVLLFGEEADGAKFDEGMTLNVASPDKRVHMDVSRSDEK